MPAIPLLEGREFGGESPLAGLDLPQSEYLPPEYGRQMLGQLELGRERQEEDRMREFLEGINAMGRMYTGSALREGITQLLGPSIERGQGMIGDIALRGVEAQRGERLVGEERDWRTSEAALDRSLQERELAQQQQQFFEGMAERERVGERERAGQRRAGRFSTQLSDLGQSMALRAISNLPAMITGGIRGAGGGGGGGTGGSIPSLDLDSTPYSRYGTSSSRNMFGRNLGY